MIQESPKGRALDCPGSQHKVAEDRKGRKVLPLSYTFREFMSVFSNARAKVVQKKQRLQGKLTPACEFPSVCFRKSFFSKSKRTSVPSGTEETPRGVSARAQGPTGPTSGIPAPRQVP